LLFIQFQSILNDIGILIRVDMEPIKFVFYNFFAAVFLLFLLIDDEHIMFLKTFGHWIRNFLICLVFNGGDLVMPN
jgi:hypothetical protein